MNMEAETKDQTDETTKEQTQEQMEKIPLSKLRDLRPEKDPIGAAGNRSVRAETRTS